MKKSITARLKPNIRIEKKILTFYEACEYMGLTQEELRKLIKGDRIAFNQPLPDKFHFRIKTVDDFVTGITTVTTELNFTVG